MSNSCQFHLIYRVCNDCGRAMERGQVRECIAPQKVNDRVRALRQARTLLVEHAKMTWDSGQTERSDGITNVLVEFDQRFPEAREA